MAKKNWSLLTVGASDADATQQRAKVLDGFHTPKIATRKLLEVEPLGKRILDPANGFNRISNVLESHGHKVFRSDIYRWSKKTEVIKDFRDFTKLPPKIDLVFNPPFVHAEAFVRKSIELLEPNRKVCMLARLQFLESQGRYQFFQDYPPEFVHIFTFRLPRMRRFRYHGKQSGNTLAFAWFVWRKGWNGSYPQITFIKK